MHDLDAGKQLFLRMLALARDLGDRLQMAWALAFLSYIVIGEPQAALPLVEESLALFHELHHPPGIAQALTVIGEIARYYGDDERAKHAYEECLTILKQTGETRRIGFLYQNLAFIALHEGDAERARDLALQALQIARAMNNRLGQAKSLPILAGTLGAVGQAQRAARLLGASESALERLGAFYEPNDQPEIDGIIAAVRVQLDETTFQMAWEEGRKLLLEQAVAQAIDA